MMLSAEYFMFNSKLTRISHSKYDFKFNQEIFLTAAAKSEKWNEYHQYDSSYSIKLW